MACCTPITSDHVVVDGDDVIFECDMMIVPPNEEVLVDSMKAIAELISNLSASDPNVILTRGEMAAHVLSDDTLSDKLRSLPVAIMTREEAKLELYFKLDDFFTINSDDVNTCRSTAITVFTYIEKNPLAAQLTLNHEGDINHKKTAVSPISSLRRIAKNIIRGLEASECEEDHTSLLDTLQQVLDKKLTTPAAICAAL